MARSGKALRQRLRLHGGSSNHHLPDAEDLFNDVVVRLIEKLSELRAHPSKRGIRNFRVYVARVATNACNDYLRVRKQERHRLKHKLRNLLDRHPDFRVWKGENNAILCGLTVWKSQDSTLVQSVSPEQTEEVLENLRTMIFTSKAPQDLPLSKVAVQTLKLIGQAIELDQLVQIIADFQGVKDRLPESLKPPAQRRYRTAAFVVVLLTILSVSAYFGSRYLSARSSPPVEDVTFQKLTFTSEIAFPIISPDGRSIAYVQENRVFLQDVASGTSVKLEIPEHEKFGNLQFSNDSGSIIFHNEDSFDAGGDAFQISRFGGPAKRIAERVWSTIGFAPDGINIAFVRFFPTEGEWAVMLKDLGSGNERKLISRNLPYTIFRQRISGMVA